MTGIAILLVYIGLFAGSALAGGLIRSRMDASMTSPASRR